MTAGVSKKTMQNISIMIGIIAGGIIVAAFMKLSGLVDILNYNY